MQLWGGFVRSLGVARAFKAVLLILVLAGCGGGNGRVVGKWSGQIKPSSESKGLGNAMTGLASALIGNLTFEFNAEGRYKASMNLGTAAEGTYAISGNEVTLTPDDGKKTTVFIIDGDTMRAKKSFDSDPALVMTRQPSG